jgi:probable F420-dependent oxidoreductase
MALKVRFAVSAPGFGPDLRPFAMRSEALGFDTLWLSDIPIGAPGDPIVSLAAMAACTGRIHLGTNLVPLGRNPMLLARQLAQLDQLSAGRLLITLVPGLDLPGEREALAFGKGNRGAYLEQVTHLLRRWWAGEVVTHHDERFAFEKIAVAPQPVQDPLEIWFGGRGPKALERVGRLGDGWLTAGIGPAAADAARLVIHEAAAAAGRVVDPEHLGISMPFARHALSDGVRESLTARYPQERAEDLVPVGAAGLEKIVREYVDAGLSKFVLRQVDGGESEDDLAWLADTVLPLQNGSDPGST